jgi:uncharacterized protein YgiM (DUF1202 family)
MVVACPSCKKEIQVPDKRQLQSAPHTQPVPPLPPQPVPEPPPLALPTDPPATNVEVQTLQFLNSAAGQAHKNQTIAAYLRDGWQILSETVTPGHMKGEQACCLAMICLPLGFAAGRSSGVISVTMQRRVALGGPKPSVPSPMATEEAHKTGKTNTVAAVAVIVGLAIMVLILVVGRTSTEPEVSNPSPVASSTPSSLSSATPNQTEADLEVQALDEGKQKLTSSSPESELSAAREKLSAAVRSSSSRFAEAKELLMQLDRKINETHAKQSPPASAPLASIYEVTKIPNGDYLNIRSGPGSTYSVINKLPPGSNDIVLGSKRVPNGAVIWQEITFQGQTGWVNADYIRPSKVLPASSSSLPPALARQSGGLGIPRSEIQNVLEAPPFGVVFKNAPLSTGEPRVMGSKESTDGKGIAIIELVGASTNLTKVTCNVATENNSAVGAVQNAAILLAVLKKTLPDWGNGSDWLNASLKRIKTAGEERTTFRQTEIRLTYLKSLGLITLSISSRSP